MTSGREVHPPATRPGGSFALGPAGQLAGLAFCLAMPPLTGGWDLAAVAAISLMLAARAGRHGVAALGDRRTWILITAVALPVALLAGRGAPGGDAAPPAGDGYVLGAEIALRVLSMTLGVSAFAASVSVGDLSAVAERLGLRGLGFALGVAMNALPTMAEQAAHGFHAIRLRGGFRKRRLASVRLWLIAVVAASLRHADEVVSAAEARAFVATRRRRLPPIGGWPDALAAILLGAAAAVILV